MEGPNSTESRMAWIGLTVLVVATMLVFAFVFLDAGRILDHSSAQSSTSTDTDDKTPSTDSDLIAAEIEEYRTIMNGYQTKKDSPYLILVDEAHPLPEDYTVELAPLHWGGDSLRMEKIVASSINTFLSAADRAGYSVTVTAAYRSRQEQQRLYDAEVSRYLDGKHTVEAARAYAAKKVGSVDCSEHQLGFSLDFDAKSMAQIGNDGKTFATYLDENIHKFGFIFCADTERDDLPEGEEQTYHYRYVGVDVASDMKVRSIATLSEYHDFLSVQITYYKQKIDSLEKR